MKRNYLVLAAAFLAVVMLSCKKDIVERDNTYPGNTSSTAALGNFFTQNAPPIQQFTLDASLGGTINGAGGGAVIVFQPNALLYQNFQPVTGNVTVYLQEVYTKSDIIFSGGYTTSHGLALKSGGEINVTACQGNQELLVANSYVIQASIPAQSTEPMEMFFTSTIDTTTDFEPQTDSANWVAGPFPGPASSIYSFALDSFGWTNCDQYYDFNAVQTTFNVPMPTLFNDGNCKVFVTSDQVNFAAEMWEFDAVLNKFTCAYYRLTIGDEFRFSVIGEINGQFYFDTRIVTMTEEMAIALNPMPATQAEIIHAVDGF